MKSHIYEVSVLFKGDAARFQAKLKALKKERKVRFMGYKALRDAIVMEMTKPGSGEDLLKLAFARPPVNKQETSIRKNSFRALRVFRDEVRPLLGPLKRNLMTGKEPPCRWEGHELKGGFHFSALNEKGDEVFLFLSASKFNDEKDADVNQRKAIIDLLRIVAEAKHTIDPKRMWFVDLIAGKVLLPPKSYINTRKDLKRTLDHMEVVFGNGESMLDEPDPE